SGIDLAPISAVLLSMRSIPHPAADRDGILTAPRVICGRGRAEEYGVVALGQIVGFRRPPKDARPQRPQPRMSLGPWLYIIALAVIVALWQSQSVRPQTSGPTDSGGDIVAPANAARIADGDSIDVGRLRMRLDGIDAPELV